MDRSPPKEELKAQLAKWQTFYSQDRTHSSIGSRTPMQKLQEKRSLIPTAEAVHATRKKNPMSKTRTTSGSRTINSRPRSKGEKIEK